MPRMWHKATDLLRPFVQAQFCSMSKTPDEEWTDMLEGEYIINGAKQSDFDAAKVFLDGFDSRRKARKRSGGGQRHEGN